MDVSIILGSLLVSLLCFLGIVQELTGSELTGDAWTNALKESVEDKVAREKKEYDEAIAKASKNQKDTFDESHLDMTVRFVDGDTIISDSTSVGLLGACAGFEDFVAKRMAAEEAKECVSNWAIH